MAVIIASFCFFLVIFVVIGVLSTFKSKSTTNDYLLAGQTVKPWLVALSAVATNNSGYMFIGMIGYTYIYGYSAIWLMLGWIIGDLCISLIAHAPIRNYTVSSNSQSYSELLGRWQGLDYQRVSKFAGFIIIIFLSIYAAAQLKAGSKALHVLFAWDISLGAVIGAGMVLLYCFAGGIRASIWTDAAQSFVMIVAMALLCITGVSEIGGIGAFVDALHAISPEYSSLKPQEVGDAGLFFTLLYIAGWFFAGIAVVGQPHIMVRFMAMRQVQDMHAVRLYYYSWFTAFFALTIVAGLLARVLIPAQASFDAELALPLLALDLLPGVLVGLVLAGLFAATMSTADSQILSCTASLTRDIFRGRHISFVQTKIATVFFTVFSLGIALFAPHNVFELVLIAWSGLASAFAPLIIAYCLDWKMKSEMHIICGMGLGLCTVLLWHYADLNMYTYEVFPGMLVGLGALYLTRDKSLLVKR